MKKTFKKALSVLLVAVMVFGSAPLAGFVGIELPAFNLFGTKADAATSGYFTYSDSNYQVTITDVSTSISGSVTIPATLGGYPVTSIDDNAFRGCTGLTSITIPDSVTSIGYHAFSSCTGLTSITIPDSVTSIGSYAFEDCTGLTSITVDVNNPNYSSDEYGVLFNKDKTELIQYPAGNERISYTIPDSVTSIGYYAFYDCDGLTIVTIGNSVTSIGYAAFEDCTGLTSITIPDSVTSIGSYAFEDCTGLTRITIPDSVTSIGDSAFSGCTGLTRITIPDSVTSIGSRAFSDCTGLTGVTIGNSVTSIGDSAFYHCTGLTSVTIPDSVTSIGNSAFSGCDGLTSVTIPDSVTSIGYGAFYDCTGLKSVTIPNSVTSIGGSAFKGCTGLTSVTIPDSVTSIGEDAFEDCTGLTSVTIGNGVTGIGSEAFSGCTGLTSVTIPDSVTSIGSQAFYGCTGLTSDGVTSIGWSAFYECTGLTSVTIPDSVTSIGDSAFYNCKGLTSVTIGNGVTSIGEDAFYNTGIYNDSSNWENGVLYIGNYLIKAKTTISGDYTIKTGTKVIADYAFSSCTKLTSVTIPDSVMNIGEDAFYNTGIYNDSSNWENGVLYIGNYLIKADSTISGDYSIKPGTKALADYAFQDCDGLTSVTIPDSVTSICNDAFYSCDGLTSVTIPDSVTSIGKSAFYSCDGLTSVTIPDGVTSIGSYALYDCDGLTSITIPDSVTSIGDGAFSECNKLTSVTIPDSVTSIGSDTFYKCTGLTSVTIPDSVTSIGNNAFRNCTGLTNVTIGNCVTSIGDYAFEYCYSLTSVTIPDSVTSIGKWAFAGCNNLSTTYYVGTPEQWRDISIGSYNGSINRNIIFECNSERPYYQGTCGENLTWTLYTDGKLVIDGTGDMTDYSSSSNAPWYSKRLTVNSVTIGNGVTSIGSYAYNGCTGLTSVSIPNSVTSIGSYAFYKCTGLASVTIGNNVTSIGDYAFYNCTGLTSVTIPDSVTSIGDRAFSGCNNIATTYYSGTPEQWSKISIGSNNGTISKNIVFECNSERPNYGKGACGDNLTWTLYTDGELVIDGMGDMTDYSSISNVPWNSKRSKIKSATILDGVTSIGDYAFYSCTGLTSETIPDSVTSIGDYAFYGCTNLEKIAISAYSVEIADNAFDNSPKVIFYCKSGSTVQSYAELNDIMYILIDGPASGFAVKNNQLVAYKGESENPQIPSGVTSIGANSFKDNGTVKTVELPNSVSSIFSGAFSNCSSLERIVVPHTVTTIAPDAFNGTNATIVCYANSYAHQYAVEKGMNVELISVTLNQTKVILSVGEYSIITATPEQEYLDSVQTSWKSSDTGVATVDANGKVTALCNGTATIYALAPTGETLATCSVQVGYSFRITIQNPSTKTISYKSGIILHATADNLPAGAKIVWEKDNDNFSMSDDGNGNCKIVSKANGSTTFTAKVKLADGSIAKDSNGNEISAQVTMNSKAGFFDKIVAFFKGLFGGNKVLPQLFKGIF